MTPTEIYQDAITPEKTKEEEAAKQATQAEEVLLAQAKIEGAKRWINSEHTQDLLNALANKRENLIMDFSILAVSGNPSNELIRAKIVEQAALLKVMGYITGELTKL